MSTLTKYETGSCAQVSGTFYNFQSISDKFGHLCSLLYIISYFEHSMKHGIQMFVDFVSLIKPGNLEFNDNLTPYALFRIKVRLNLHVAEKIICE